MLRPLVRSFLSAAVAGCFALSALAWGTTGECPRPGPSAAASGHGPGHDASGGHAPEHTGHDARACAVHLCCAHLAPQAPVTFTAERLGTARGDAGFAAGSAVLPSRAAHSLPFAHGPPRPIV